MKVVHQPEDAQSAFDSATREAQAYFGRPEAYLERYLTRPRHVEIQVFCDTHGGAVYFGDRDCSTQRRHQKLIEEAPAPGIPDDTRAAMGEAAVKVARACGYVGAGTVEMLYQDGAFYFLEMNTRLQVEHCVTEEVTASDLVAEQIRVASGLPLSVAQDEISMRGHAIECRINAEDPARQFMPSPGRIDRMRIPGGPGVRWDGGYAEGDTVSQFYDNLIGKLVVWAPDRDRAIARMVRALGELEIEGVATTTGAHIALLRHADFAAARHSTKWVEDEVDHALFPPAAPVAEAPADDGEPPLIERSVPVEVDGKRFTVKVWLPESTSHASSAQRSGARARPKVARASSAGGAGSGTVTAPMQGTIVKVLVEVDAQVEIGQALLVLEAMKMENHINAEISGTVREIRVSVGDSVGTGDALVVLE